MARETCDWIADSPIRNPLRVLVVGAPGVGKSSLINRLLGSCVAKEGDSGLLTTMVVQKYSRTINGVSIEMFDTPGLQDPEKKDAEVIQEIAKATNHEVDLILYCVSMRGSITNADVTGVELLTRAFGNSIWKNAVFVLTFADQVSSDVYENRLSSMRRVLCRHTEKIASIKNVPVVAACDDDLQFTNWPQRLLEVTTARVKAVATPALLQVRYGSIQVSVEPILDTIGDVTYKMVGTGLLVGACGALLGAGIGTLTSSRSNAISGALTGARIGVLLGTTLGASVDFLSVSCSALKPSIKRPYETGKATTQK